MATKRPANPLTANDLAGAQAVVDTYAEVVAEAARCTACGMQVQPIVEQAKAYHDFAAKVLEQYGSMGAASNE